MSLEKEMNIEDKILNYILHELNARDILDDKALDNALNDEIYNGIKEGIMQLIKNNAWDIVAMLSKELLIANWYEKEDLENILGHSITDKQYKEIVEAWNRYAIHDQINEIIRMFVENYGGGK